MPQPSFRVRVTKDHLVFSAAHFITFNGNICERLHGHNWRVAVEVTGGLDENRYVFDFIALRDATQNLVNELDHRVLLPESHPMIRVTDHGHEVEATFEERRWIFPREDAVILPVQNTTAEEIAQWMVQRLVDDVIKKHRHELQSVRVDVEENFGQWAQCELQLP
ncbi:6-pyruvoyl trahydropterin synthase family protein [Rubinisphaera margarita]|uniref:6-pyruvoyl trahydropterin synthase family protein n=1 Tax=Rubinisphaera margarita TaxID=2909586 RepID=UPI001EE8ACD1|nr:6-pyruvoyl tetrahydropterin synthase family protein [Rubinisphaera margarita]MCG6154285.1 6-pyruvoyl tetrahydropterin synthase family protein [Rubinisphaera margarita]